MGTIAEKLAAARKAAVESSGLETGTKTAAPANQSIAKAPVSAPRTPSKTSVSVLKPADLIPRKTKESQVLFKCIKPSLNCAIAGVGKPVKRIAFVNQYLLTEDTEVIEYLRKNAAHFSVSEVADKKPE